MVVAAEDNTAINVYYTDNSTGRGTEQITLQKYEIFTRDCYYVEGRPHVDFTGTHVVATKPVSVYSGNGASYLYAQVSIILCTNRHRDIEDITLLLHTVWPLCL